MTPESKGVIYKSNPLTWSSGGSLDFDRSFLREAQGSMAAPVVREIIFHARLEATGVTATLLSKDAHKVFDRIQVGDRGGLLFDCSGVTARTIEIMELGDAAWEPNGGTALASAATTAAYDVFARVIFDVEKGNRGADYGLPLNHLFDGGKLWCRGGTPPGCTMTGATIRVYAVVHDERQRELKSRMVWREQGITKTEDYYAVNGSLRAAFVSSTLTATGFTGLGSECATVTSRNLKIYDYDYYILQQEYRRIQGRGLSSNDPFLDSLTDPSALALCTPSRGQHIGKMPDLETLHLKMVSAPTSGQVVTCRIEDRNIPLAAETMGYDNPADFVAAFNARGQVSNKGKASGSIKGWDSKLVRRMPATIPL